MGSVDGSVDFEEVFRVEWPRIVGAVARYTSDLQLAEDCVQEALLRALDSGVEPRNPAAWLTTTARRIAVDSLRRDQMRERIFQQIGNQQLVGQPAVGQPLGDGRAFSEETMMPVDPRQDDHTLNDSTFAGDEQLLLLILAADPQLTQADQVAVALRFVCGESTADIARVLLLPEPTLAARLTRAKKRLAANGVMTASADALLERIDPVLTTLYLLFTLQLDQQGSATAVALTRQVTGLLPGHRESLGLLALMLLTLARRTGGASVDLKTAHRSLWDQELIHEGSALAAGALPGGERFALQAGIAGLHSTAPSWDETDWPSIHGLYVRLESLWPAPAVTLNRIVALSHIAGVGLELALAQLDSVFAEPTAALAGQVWAARADILRRLGRSSEAVSEYRKALAASTSDADSEFLRARIAELG